MVPRSIKRPLVAAALCVMAAGAAAQTTRLTLEDIYSYDGWTRFNGSRAATMTWVPDGDPWLSDTHHLWPAPSEAGGSAQGRVEGSAGPWLRVDAASGASRPLYTYAQLERALADAGAPSGEARSASRQRHSTFNSARDAILITIGDALYVYRISMGTATRVTASAGQKTEATFSPDGRSVAFIKNHNLFVAGVDGSAERALTSDGHALLLNGTLDWLYSEELYGRGHHRGYWWSPDSSRIAFLQFDERAVPEYTLIDDIPYRETVERHRYPKAGDPNPTVRLGVVSAAAGNVRWVDTARYSDFLIVSVAWVPNSREVAYQIQDRTQTWLDLNRADAETGAARHVLRETSKAWVERWQDSSVDPIWLQDGSFLWLSERSGWRHFYRYAADGTLMKQLTQGDWEIRRTHGIDSAGRWVYFTSTTHSPVGLDLYRVGVDGTELQRLSTIDGRHQVFVNPSRSLFLDSWSDLTTPPQVRLYSTGARNPVRVVDANPVPPLAERGLSAPEMLQVKTRDGFVMEAMMIKPPGFDPAKRYPVYQFTYAGPHTPQVVNAWGGTDFLYHQLLAQQGIIVWICDNRTASGKGMQSAWPLYKNFGALELRDIEDGISWLTRQPFIDASRIGISGISFGAYMTLYAMTHSRLFSMGIAEGAVSDWRTYDTIYTERYMGLPADNPDGYRRSSPRFAAASLNGSLLLVHGALDDNVHPQNSMQFAYELQQAGKLFRMMLYPRSAHGIGDPGLYMHLRRTMLDFTTQNLLR
jgi:dipeptidyl-peptidase 4